MSRQPPRFASLRRGSQRKRSLAGTREVVANAAREGFLSGLNGVLVIGAVLAFAGAALALWLVRENEIERDQPQLVAAGEQALEASAG